MCQRRMIFKMRRLSTEFTRTLFALLLLTMVVLVLSALYLNDSMLSSNWKSIDGSTAYVRDFDLLKDQFTEPYEVLLVIFPDLKGIAITSEDEAKIAVPESIIVDQIKQRGKELADVLGMVHNHPDPSRFSEKDNRFYYRMVDQGFDGFFCIYYPHSGKVLAKEKK